METGDGGGGTKYIEVGHHRDMMGNQHFTVGSNLYEKVRLFIDKSKFYSGGNKM